MRTRNIIIVLITVISTLFSMSNGDTDIPKKDKIVIDQFGYNTGLQRDEYNKHLEKWLKKAKSLGMWKGLFKADFETYYNFRINLNKYDEFLKNDLDLKKIHIGTNCSYKENTLISNIIVSGKILSQRNTDHDYFKNEYIIEIDNMLKNYDLNSNPNYLIIKSSDAVHEKKLLNNKKYLFFLSQEYVNRKKIATTMKKEIGNKQLDLSVYTTNAYSTIQLDENLKNIEEIKAAINAILEINYLQNFYRTAFPIKEE